MPARNGEQPSRHKSRRSSSKRVNLDWTRDPPPPRLTKYQEYVRSVDWSQTAFGPMQSWTRGFRQMVLLMMAEVDPVILYWGDENAMMYNEAYVPLIGKKHPHAHGKNAADVFPNFWAYFDRIIDEQRHHGETRVGEASMLMMERHGFIEETYFNWKLIPVIGDDGSMLGAYGRPAESSHEIIHARRVACIQSLAQHISGTVSLNEMWSSAVHALARNDKDVPLAMMYMMEQHPGPSESPQQPGSKYHLQGVLGIREGHPCAKSEIDIQQDLDGLAPHMLTALHQQSMHAVFLTDIGLKHGLADIDWRGFRTPCKELVFVPMKVAGTIAAILICGLNPHLPFVNDYREFIQMIADVLAPQISRFRLVEEAHRRDQAAEKAVQEFQRSELKFARFADRSPLGLTLTDKEGKVMYANDAWHRFVGLNSSEPEFSSWVDTVYEDDLPIVHREWQKCTQLKESSTFQVRCKQPFVSGNMHSPYRTGIVNIYPDLDDEGNIATLMGLVLDISELKWIEEQLRLRQDELEESEKKYRNFAEYAPIGVVRTDSEGYVQFANDAWRLFYNYSRDHKLTEPEPWLRSLNNEDVPLAREFFQDIKRTPGPKTVEVRLKSTKRATESKKTSPAECWLLATGFAEYRSDGSIDHIAFWVTDISDQKAAEKVVTEKMEEALRLKDAQEKFVDMISHEIRNPLSAILHCGEEIVGAMKNCLMLMDDLSNDETMTRNHINGALDAANTIMYCVQHQKQIVDDVLTLSKLDADLLVVSPIPAQPTEVVRSALKIFEPELKASAIELAFEIDSSLDDLNVDWIMLDPNRFLQIIINLVTNAIKFTRGSQTRKIVLSVTARLDPPPREYQGVHYVPRRQTERKDMDGVAEDTVASPSSAGGQELYLCFSVADTGKGLTDTERTTLFNRFTQASPKTHIEYGGSGLGLFISRQITELLGGEIGVGSVPGKGATFSFYVRTRRAIPPRRASLGVETVSLYSKTLVEPTPGTWVTNGDDNDRINGVKEEASDDKLRHGRSPKPVTQKRRVLVVEDNLINQRVLCKQLRNRGFLVDTANHGKEALTALEEDHKRTPTEERPRFDVILCDIEMPVMNGIECVTEIRRREREGQFEGHIPIIGVTANVRSKQVNTALEVGMDGVTTKPYRIDELIAHMDRIVVDATTSSSPFYEGALA